MWRRQTAKDRQQNIGPIDDEFTRQSEEFDMEDGTHPGYDQSDTD